MSDLYMCLQTIRTDVDQNEIHTSFSAQFLLCPSDMGRQERVTKSRPLEDEYYKFVCP
jgi:hypothetical protein